MIDRLKDGNVEDVIAFSEYGEFAYPFFLCFFVPTSIRYVRYLVLA